MEKHSERVLIVEDEILIRIVLADELRAAGFEIIECASADEALTYIEAGGQIDLVFSDIRMPGAIDGVSLARRVRTAYPSLPIILTSGDAGPEVAGDLGLFVPKPYPVARIVDLIRRTLAGLGPKVEARSNPGTSCV